MSAFPFIPAQAYVKTFDTGEVVQCGGILVSNPTDLATVRLLLYYHGTPGGSENLRAKIYTDAGYTQLLANSDWSSLAAISNPSTDWWGWFSLNFSTTLPLGTDSQYYVAIETQNYTRGASDVFYLAASYDWPVPQNTNVSAAGHYALAMQVYGYRGP